MQLTYKQVLQVFLMDPDEFETFEQEPIILGSGYKEREGVSDEYIELVWGTLINILQRAHRYSALHTAYNKPVYLLITPQNTELNVVLGSEYEKKEDDKDVEYKGEKRLLLDLKTQLEAEMTGQEVSCSNNYVMN